MMPQYELELMLKKLTYCTEVCESFPYIEGCHGCENKVPPDAVLVLLKSYGQIIGALETLSGATEVYRREPNKGVTLW